MTSSLDYIPDAVPYIMEGQVVSTDDPDQMGRVRLWVPALDGENFVIEQLPWAEYASPFGGFTVEYQAGNGTSDNKAQTAYGFWAIPKVGATVLVFCLNANPAARFYFASTTRLHRNRSLPAGRNTDFNGAIGPFGDDGDEKGNLVKLQPAYDNLREQFQSKVTASEAVTRGAYERQVAQAKDDKDGKEGYSKSPVDTYLDPQTYCIVTPGRHAIIMQDDPNGSRIRFKTGEGHQIIFDDTNERIYMSTAKGKSWVELDQDGHINIFGSDSISVRSGKDINFFADRDINLEAVRAVNVKANTGDIRLHTGKSFQLKADADIKQSACGIFDLDCEGSIKATAAASMDLKAGSNLALTGGSGVDVKAGSGLALTGGSGVDIKGGGAVNVQGSAINLNGSARDASSAAAASCPELALDPTVVPGHEPWTRPKSTQTRNKRWKE
jgi:phage gp45-like